VSQAAIAERYARAIFELAEEAGQLGAVSTQLRGFADVLASSDELRAALENPVLVEASRDALVKDIGARLGMSPVALNAARLVAQRRRLPAMAEIASLLTRLADEKSGLLRATVTSAKPLPEDYYQRLSQELEKRTQRKIVLERQQDPSLIAGVVTRIGDHTIDGSVKGRLAALERELRAST
jgi:F-type H+-transporting ATPase subunit delta